MDVIEGNYEDTSTKFKDAAEKYASNCQPETTFAHRLTHDDARSNRLRRADVDAEHTERQSKRYEQERDQWEKKCEVRFDCSYLFS